MAYLGSPITYMGSKYRMLGEMLPKFPENIKTFVDMFGGAGNVSLNVEAEKIVYNEYLWYLTDIMQFFKDNDNEVIDKKLKEIVIQNGLVSENTPEAQAKFRAFRTKWNNDKVKCPLELYVLATFSFNYMFQWNRSGGFNCPFGKEVTGLNPTKKSKIFSAADVLKEKDIKIVNGSFEALDTSALGAEDFVYADPPYLITTAGYNNGAAGGGWDEEMDKKLFDKLDELNKQGVKWAMSNVFYHKGETNEALIEWAKNYNTHFMKGASYLQCSSWRSDLGDTKTVEVLITNY